MSVDNYMSDDQVQQPMILVKKPDGTTVRVPLASLRGTKNNEQPARIATPARQPSSLGGGQSVAGGRTSQTADVDTTTLQHYNTTTQPVASISISPKHDDKKLLSPEPPQVLLEESYEDDGLQKTKNKEQRTEVEDRKIKRLEDQPQIQNFRPQALYRLETGSKFEIRNSNWSADDHDSLLNETLDTTTPHTTSAIRGEAQVVDFLKTISFSIKPELQGRAIALLSSFLKGVRSRQQVLEYAVKPVETGGLQLADVDAQSLVQQAEEYFHIRPSVPGKRTAPLPVAKEPVLRTPPRPTVQIVPNSLASTITERPRISDIVLPASPVQQTPVTNVSSNSIVSVDIPEVAPAVSVGPAEEIETFTADDFRRLHADPVRAVDTLLLQMQHVQQESPMLGLSVQRAWFRSPLYRQYLHMLQTSLQNSFLLNDLSGDAQSALSVEEVRAILRINRACEEV